jgi:predicted porin
MAAPMAAQADVKVYGKVNVEYSVTDIDTMGSVQQVNDDGGTSRWGIKATEKLGGGLTAIAVVEFGLDAADNGSENMRQQYVGLKGSWGTFMAGTTPNVYGTTGGVKLDPFNATMIQARSAGGMSRSRDLVGHHDFIENSLAYVSPNINGFQAKFTITPDETGNQCYGGTGKCGTLGASGNDNDWVVGLTYKNGPWFAGLAHAHNNNASPTDDEKATKLTGSWKSGNHFIGGQYEWIDDAAANNGGGFAGGGKGGQTGFSSINAGEDGHLWFLDYNFTSGNNIFSVAIGGTESDDESNNLASSGNDTDFWRIGVIHKFSKQTRVFAGYMEADTNTSTSGTATLDADVWTIGLRKDF